jgi:hypothetical protein
MARWLRAIRGALHGPIAWVLAATCLLRAVGIGWGLPASDGWDNDGVAPRDFLTGLFETLTPGHYNTYPPVHLALLALLTAPVTLLAVARAPALTQAGIVGEILKPGYMTAIALEARVTTLVMSLGIVVAVAKVAEELRGPRAGVATAAVLAVNVALTYYAHTTNLDVPYIFWGCLALLALVRAVARREPRLLRRWAIFATLAVATKDQAYALFLLGAPATVALWLAVDAEARARARGVLRESALATAIGAGLLLVADAIVFNPTGFRARVRFLLGPASQGFANYTDDWAGRWDVVHDVVHNFGKYYPLAFAPLVLLGLGIVVVGARDRARLAAGLAPLLAAASFTLAFNCTARRTDHRFVLPQSIFVAVYMGVALDVLLFQVRPAAARWLARAGVAVAFAVALFAAVDVDVNLLFDPRYEAEAWLRARARDTDGIETYGLNVYLPRFPSGPRVVRVGPEPVDRRNPMPGIEEVADAYGNAEARGPRFIVVSEGWVWRYLIEPVAGSDHGRMQAPTQRATASDQAATDYFRKLTSSEYGPYRIAHVSRWESKVWPALEIHASTSRDIWIYERQLP